MRPEPEQLAAVPLLASLKPEQLQAIATLSELRSEPEGTELAGEGAPGYALFIIIAGTATVTSGDAELAILGPGDFFGEIALLAGERRRTATVMAASPVTLAVMFGSDFHVFERDFPEASAQMKQAMDERLER